MQTVRNGDGQEVGHEFCLFHNAVDVLHRIIEQLHGTVDGDMLYVLLTAVEEEIEEQTEHHRDDEHNQEAKTEFKPLLDVSEESFHEAAGSLMSWSSSSVMVSVPCMISACREAISSFESFM